jgi:hypothetical protein
METNEFTFAHDAAHGWLRVPQTMLMQLKIDWAISEYSYAETTPVGDVWWLEEDMDASLFIQAYRARFACLPFLRHREDGDYSPVRNLRHVQQIVSVPFDKVTELLAHLRAKGDEACAVAA